MDSYCADYIRAFNSQYQQESPFYFLSPQLLNLSLKNINMNGMSLTQEDIQRMVLEPHRFELQLRNLASYFYNSVSLFRRDIDFKQGILDFDWEPIPYRADGKEITISDMHTKKYQKAYATLTRFFNSFNVKREFAKVVFNLLLYDTYFVSLREYDGHMYLQELPSSHCIIDAVSYLGYLFSFDLSYFTNAGVDIYGYSDSLIKKFNNALKQKEMHHYNPNLPDRNGSWVYWQTMTPDDAWVFKFHQGFAGSVPPVLDTLSDYNKLENKYKDLETTKKELETYKVVFATVPRLSNGRAGNKTDDFAISATELGKFIATVKSNLPIDFKAAPLEDFKAFDFSPSGSEDNLLATEVSNVMKESGLADAVLVGGNSVSALNLYKQVKAREMEQLYYQFEQFCEYHINKNLNLYKFKIKFVGNIFDREDRRKASNEDMERGIITPRIFSSRGMQLTDVNNVMNMMQVLTFPDRFTPIKTASTMSSKEKESVGRTALDDNNLSDAGEQTRDIGANDEKKGV